MVPKFKYIKRTKEIHTIQQGFYNIVSNRSSNSFIIQGRNGVGKTRFIEEFFSSIENDKYIMNQIPEFLSEKNIIRYSCNQVQASPYQPFIEITKQINQKARAHRILMRFGMLLISLFPFHDAIDDLQKLGSEISETNLSDNAKKKELKIFQKYLNVLRKRSSKTPLIIYIENVQWIDEHSLDLLYSLIMDTHSFWGLIILEIEDITPNNKYLHDFLIKLDNENKINRITLRAMPKGFEKEILENIAGDSFLTISEFEHIYTLCEGYPGKLIKLFQHWLSNNWLYQENGKWYKVSKFEHKIKPPYQKLLDLIITFLQDDVIEPREQKMINNFAQEWDINDDTVAAMIDMITQCRKLGYEIEEKVHNGTIAQYAFLALDKNRNKYIIEYIPCNTDSENIIPREISHHNILGAKEIIQNEKGIIIVNDYYSGKNLKELSCEQHESHIVTTVDTAIQIAEALNELHRNGYVHGYIRPESVIKSDDGSVFLSGIDVFQIQKYSLSSDKRFKNNFPYSSPEQLKQEKPEQSSDIYSLGVLIYELITDELPYDGNDDEIKHSIIYENIDFDRPKINIPEKIKGILIKCLAKNPNQRYQSINEIITDLNNSILKTEQENIETENEVIHAEKEVEISSTKNRRPPFVYGVISLFIISIVFVFYFRKNNQNIAKNEIVIDKLLVDDSIIKDYDVTPDMLRFLLDLKFQQSTNINPLSESQFNLKYSKHSPEMHINCDLKKDDLRFDLFLEVNTNNNYENIHSEFYDFSALLNQELDELINYTRNVLNISIKNKVYTTDWDAFKNYYYGVNMWKKLEVNKASSFFQSAIDIDPGFTQAKLKLAQVQTFNGNQNEAKNLIDQIKNEFGHLNYIDSLNAEALLARLSGDLRQEIKILREKYNAFPEDKESAYEIAEAYYNLCDIENAIEFYKRALAIDKSYALAYNHLGYSYSHQGDHTKALNCFRTYVKLDSTANSYDSWGDGLFAAGKLDSAEWAKMIGLSLNPSLDYLYSSLAYICIFDGKINKARENINKYLDVTKSIENIAQGYYLKGLVDFICKDYESSIKWTEKSIQTYDSKNPVSRNHEAHWLLGMNYYINGSIKNLQDEINEMEEIIQKYDINTTNYQIGLYKFYLHLKLYKAFYDSDLDEIESIIRVFEGPISTKLKDHGSPFDLAYFYNSFGELYLKYHKLDQAKYYFEKAINTKPNYVFPHINMYHCYIINNKQTEAEYEKQKILQIWNSADTEILSLYGINI